jgi:hypothetical protein
MGFSEEVRSEYIANQHQQAAERAIDRYADEKERAKASVIQWCVDIGADQPEDLTTGAVFSVSDDARHYEIALTWKIEGMTFNGRVNTAGSVCKVEAVIRNHPTFPVYRTGHTREETRILIGQAFSRGVPDPR